MSVDMRPEAILDRLQRTAPPDLRPESRLSHKLDMSAEGIARRLDQVSQLRALGRFLQSAGAALEPTRRDTGP